MSGRDRFYEDLRQRSVGADTRNSSPASFEEQQSQQSWGRKRVSKRAPVPACPSRVCARCTVHGLVENPRKHSPSALIVPVVNRSLGKRAQVPPKTRSTTPPPPTPAPPVSFHCVAVRLCLRLDRFSPAFCSVFVVHSCMQAFSLCDGGEGAVPAEAGNARQKCASLNAWAREQGALDHAHACTHRPSVLRFRDA